MARYTAASQMNTWEHHATGLTPGASVTFTLVLYLWDSNEEKWQQLKTINNIIVAGEIWGVVKRDTIWRGGAWNLHGTVWVQDGARLTIDGGAVVTLAPDASPWNDGTIVLDDPNAALEIENATLRDMHINVGSPDGGVSRYPAILAIRNSTQVKVRRVQNSTPRSDGGATQVGAASVGHRLRHDTAPCHAGGDDL